MNPGVSIVVPSYNRTKLLFETLQSVRNQTSPDWECLIVDDGSTEEHVKAVSRWIEDDVRFRLIHRTDGVKGAPACRNVGWKSAKYELILFLDSDDLISKDCIATRLKVSSQKPGLDFWVFSTLLFDQAVGDSDLLVNVMTAQDPILRFLSMDVIWLTSGVLWKKDVLNRLGGWDETLLSWQDWDLNLRALLAGHQFAFYSTVDNYFRVRSSQRESIGRNSFSHSHLDSHQKLADKICALVSENPAYLRAAGYLYFWIADQWVQQEELMKGLKVWKSALGIYPTKRYLKSKLTLVLFSIPFFETQLRDTLKRRGHPALNFWNGTFKRVVYLPAGPRIKSQRHSPKSEETTME